jgi:glycosyltransferase involved in cell wall biosynthesis
MSDTPVIDAVVIGRNEGERLRACLRSLTGQVREIIYVDSGSTDGSTAAARAIGARVVDLDMSRPFTAARARNEGFKALNGNSDFVQFVDGDCTLDPDWIPQAAAFLTAHPRAAVVCGRRREEHPEHSVYNRLCDQEWDTPVGVALACGGDALMRCDALAAVGGYRETLIAGEEPELCLRLRQTGWEIHRIDAEMTLHDARMLRFSQWWKRSRRAGFAFAEGAWLHGNPPERHWVRETRRAVAWGALLPLSALALALMNPLTGWLLLALYPAQVLRLSRKLGWSAAFFVTLAKLPEALGVLEFHKNRLMGRRATLIEYK